MAAGTPNSQRVAVMDAPGSLMMRHALIPEPEEDQIRIRVHFNGICGSDLEAYRGTRAPEFMSYPMRLGHEVRGVEGQWGGHGAQGRCRVLGGTRASGVMAQLARGKPGGQNAAKPAERCRCARVAPAPASAPWWG